jgi:hypothetical protein
MSRIDNAPSFRSAHIQVQIIFTGIIGQNSSINGNFHLYTLPRSYRQSRKFATVHFLAICQQLPREVESTQINEIIFIGDSQHVVVHGKSETRVLVDFFHLLKGGMSLPVGVHQTVQTEIAITVTSLFAIIASIGVIFYPIGGKLLKTLVHPVPYQSTLQ